MPAYFESQNKPKRSASQDPDISYWTIQEMADAFRAGRVSPVEVARSMLKRIGLLNPKVNAFSQIQEDRTLQAARESEARWRSGTARGVLDGVPFSVKDTLMAKGFANRRGSRITSSAPAVESAPIVDRLLEQGAVILGTTTTPEFGVGPVTISPLTGVTRNPWNTALATGGSSGGAAAAVASGFCTVALATDSGGSIRIPSAFNGVVGFKPTGGRIPLYPNVLGGGLSCAGPITRTVEDSAIVLNAAARPDRRDPDALPPASVNYLDDLDGSVRGQRIALSLTLGYAREVDPVVATMVEAGARILSDLGASIEEADPAIEDPLPAYKTIFASNIAYALRGMSREQEKEIGPILRDILVQGQSVDLAMYLDALASRRRLAEKMSEFHERFDLLITPTVAVLPFPAERHEPQQFERYREPRAWTPFTYPFNLTQQPASSVPCGFTDGGLPVGLQIIGRRFEDALVLRAARSIERGVVAVRRPFPGIPSGDRAGEIK